MVNADIKDLFRTDENDEIKKSSDDIYIYLLISLIVVFLQINTLIIQYILLLFVLFFFSVRTGIIYTSILFFMYNYKRFMNNTVLKYIILCNIIVSSILIIVDSIFVPNTYLFISLIVVNITTILSNIYCIFIISKDDLKKETDDKPKEEKGGINVKNINLNYRK